MSTTYWKKANCSNKNSINTENSNIKLNNVVIKICNTSQILFEQCGLSRKSNCKLYKV